MSKRRHRRLAERENHAKGGENRGYDAGKKIKGTKRHLLVDTLGLVLAVMVLPASVQDRDGGLLLLAQERGKWPRLTRIYADGGYAGQLVPMIAVLCGWLLDIVKRSDDARGFQVIRKRWIVERTFSWLDKCHRLSKDYERLQETSENIVRSAMINLMLHRLAPEAK
jgi:putative transposase